MSNLERTVYGNGKVGIAYEMVEIKTTLNVMNERLEGLGTSVSALAKSQVETDTTERIKSKSQERTVKYITIMIMFIGLLFTGIQFI